MREKKIFWQSLTHPSLTQQTVEYMKKNNMIVHFIKHLNNASVMDLLLKVISCEETSEGSGILDWLCETDLIPCLVSKFDSSNSAEVHENAAQALVDIISVSGGVASSPLIRQLESEPIVTALFDHILAQKPPGSALLHGLTVAIELLARAAAETAARQEADNQASLTGMAQLPPPLVAPAVPGEPVAAAAATGDDAAAPAAALPAPVAPAADGAAKQSAPLSPLLSRTLSRLDAFASLLKSSSAAKRVMSTGEELEPFGFEKLKIMEFFAMVVRLNSAQINTELQRLDVFATSMDAFFKYTWNNFLHATVEQIVGGVLEGDNVPLQCSLVTQTKLLDRLVAADAANAAEEAKPRGVRRGFMGHLTAISMRIQAAAACAPALEALLQAHEPWLEYVNGSLARLRAAESKPLGGHRPMGGPGESSDEDEEELDDDGDSIFDRYQLGFGTEEFGDEDDDDEHGDIHFDEQEYETERITAPTVSGATAGGAAGSFEMYEDGSDDSGDGEWAAHGGASAPAGGEEAAVAATDAAADVVEVLTAIEATPVDTNAAVATVVVVATEVTTATEAAAPAAPAAAAAATAAAAAGEAKAE
jgi:serine/threonine-protein phosphatase 6 regulatory subunit 3